MITRTRPASYCSPSMKMMLKAIIAGQTIETRSIASKAAFEALCSRGWIKNGKPTDAGREFIRECGEVDK